MSLVKLDIHDVRNIQRITIHPSPGINLIIGDNASGKSSLLEAIFILGRAKSFRSNSIKSVINQLQNQLIVTAQTLQSDGRECQMGIQLDGKSIEIRINQQINLSRSDLAYALPLQLIQPKSYELLDGSAKFRREFLDWGVFNDNGLFLPAWRNYKKALLQRNTVLKSKRIDQLNVWNKEVSYYGTIVSNFRSQYLNKFIPFFNTILNLFVDINPIQIELYVGWESSKLLEQVLYENNEKDLRYGRTHNGPHRADLILTINNSLAKDFVSRGQLKLIVLALKLAQIQLLASEHNNLACILIDDFAAELDINNRVKMLSFLSSLACQVFITATDLADIGELDQMKFYKVFHVEHGQIKTIK